MGPRTAEWEAAFARGAGVAHAVACSSGTAALLLALQAVGIGPGDEVVLPSLTFVADATIVVQLGGAPVLADAAAPGSRAAPADLLLACRTDRTKAAVVVHYAGRPVDVRPLRDAGLAVVEDCAHAAGPLTDGGPWLEPVGDVACYSFFANKN